MSTVPAIPDRTKENRFAKWRRFKILKAATASLLALVLMYAGFQGRQHARLQAKLNEITRVRNQLQQKLDEGLRPAEYPQAMALATALKTRLGQFDSAHNVRELSEAENLELRLSKATLANAEQRFADALTLITVQDENMDRSSTDAQIGRLVRVLQTRGDSFHGLREWKNALERYEQILLLKSNRVATTERMADCQYALGKTNEAFIAFGGVAKSYSNRGHASFLEGKTEVAIGQYAKALEFQTRLIEQPGRPALADKLALSHCDLANAFLVQRRSDMAIRHYEQAIEIQTRLVAQGQQALAGELAMSHHNLGIALLSQQKLEAVVAHLEKAVEIESRLVEQEGRKEWASDLAMSHNNRGAVDRAQGKLDGALANFEKAIGILNAIIEQPVPKETNPEAHRGRRPKLDVAIACSEKDIEVLTRVRPAEQAGQSEAAVTLAMTLKNRGHAYLVQKKFDAAIGDFKKSVEIYARLVEQEGQADLSPQFAMSLGPLAWIYATHPDKTFRDGSKAEELALRSCKLSEWKGLAPLQALAAACAETGNFADAVKWQEKALMLAPREDQFEVRSRLELYKSRRPYRMP